MSKRNDDEYTYLEWVTGIRMTINMYCDQEIMRISHDDEDEKPRELIRKINRMIKRYESQIPDDMKD